LDSNNIPFQDVDVSKDKAALREMIAISGGLAVPVIDVDGEIVLGFKLGDLKNKLGL
jgi:glutaredoxin